MRSRRSAITLLLFSSIVCSSTAAQQRDGASTAEPFSPTGKLSQFRGFASPRPTGQLPFNANFMYASVWAVWSAWSFCVNGQRIRVRACNTVRGFSCLGTNREVQFCDPNDPGVRTQRRRLPNSDYDVVDPWEADRQEAMKQLYTDPETDDDSDMPQLPPKLRRPSGSNSEFRARAAGVQTQSASKLFERREWRLQKRNTPAKHVEYVESESVSMPKRELRLQNRNTPTKFLQELESMPKPRRELSNVSQKLNTRKSTRKSIVEEYYDSPSEHRLARFYDHGPVHTQNPRVFSSKTLYANSPRPFVLPTSLNGMDEGLEDEPLNARHDITADELQEILELEEQLARDFDAIQARDPVKAKEIITTAAVVPYLSADEIAQEDRDDDKNHERKSVFGTPILATTSKIEDSVPELSDGHIEQYRIVGNSHYETELVAKSQEMEASSEDKSKHYGTAGVVYKVSNEDTTFEEVSDSNIEQESGPSISISSIGEQESKNYPGKSAQLENDGYEESENEMNPVISFTLRSSEKELDNHVSIPGNSPNSIEYGSAIPHSDFISPKDRTSNAEDEIETENQVRRKYNYALMRPYRGDIGKRFSGDEENASTSPEQLDSLSEFEDAHMFGAKTVTRRRSGAMYHNDMHSDEFSSLDNSLEEEEVYAELAGNDHQSNDANNTTTFPSSITSDSESHLHEYDTQQNGSWKSSPFFKDSTRIGNLLRQSESGLELETAKHIQDSSLLSSNSLAQDDLIGILQAFNRTHTILETLAGRDDRMQLLSNSFKLHEKRLHKLLGENPSAMKSNDSDIAVPKNEEYAEESAEESARNGLLFDINGLEPVSLVRNSVNESSADPYTSEFLDYLDSDKYDSQHHETTQSLLTSVAEEEVEVHSEPVVEDKKITSETIDFGHNITTNSTNDSKAVGSSSGITTTSMHTNNTTSEMDNSNISVSRTRPGLRLSDRTYDSIYVGVAENDTVSSNTNAEKMQRVPVILDGGAHPSGTVSHTSQTKDNTRWMPTYHPAKSIHRMDNEEKKQVEPSDIVEADNAEFAWVEEPDYDMERLQNVQNLLEAVAALKRRLVPPHPVAHGHQFTESRRPPNENDGMPGATPEKMFGAKQFALRQKPQNPELQTLRGIGEKSLEGTDAKEKDSPRPLPVADAAPKSTDEPLEVPPSKPINADMDMENGQPLPPLSGEDDVDTSVQLRNEGRQFLSVPGKMDPRTTMRPNPNLVTLKHQRSTTKGSSQPVTVTPSTTVIPPVLSTTTSRRPATVRPVPSIVETAVEDITGEELLSKEESDVVQSFFSNSGVQSRASGLTGGNRKLAKEQLLEKTPAAHSQSSTTVRPPMTSSISPRVSTISNESGEAEATERPQSSDNNDRHSQPVVHQEERFGFNDRELLRHVEEPNEVVDEIGLAAPFPQATRPRQPAQLMDHEEPGLAGPFFPENGLSSQQAQPPGHNELEVPHSEPGLSGPFFPERTEQDRQMIEASLKKFNGRGAALPPSINADKLEQHKSGALPPSASVNVVHAQQRVFPQIQGDARQIKEPHTRSLDPDYSFMNAKVQGDADATQQKPERQKHRSSGDFGLTGMSMKRKQKVLHSGEKPGRILDKYHAASLPPHQSVHQFAAVSAVPPPPPPLDEDIPYKPQFRSSGGPKRRKLRKKIKKIRPARPVPLLAEVFPGSTLAPVQASGYESSALAEVFPTAKTGQHGVQPADLSEDTAKALDWMLKNITKAAEVGDQHFLDQLGVHGAQYLEEKLHLVTAGDLQGGKGVFPQPAAQPYAPAQTPVQASVPAAATSSVRHPPGFGPQTPKKTEVAPARLRLPGISKPKPVGDDDSGYDIKAGVGHDANSRAFGWTSQKHSGEVQEPHVAGESRKKFSKGESGSPYRGKKSRRGGEYAGVTRLRSGVGNRIHGARTMTMDKDDDVPLKLDAPSNIPKDEQGLLEEIRRIEAQMNQMNQDIENFDADLDEPVDDAPVPEAQVPPKYPDDSAKDATQIEIHEFNSMDGRSVKGLKPFSKQNKVMLVEVPEETNIPPRTSSPQSAMDIELAPKNGFVPNKEPVTEDRTPGNPVEPVIMSGRASGSDSEDFWNEWTVWGRCFCGKQVRTRTCNYVEGISLTGCEGNSYETRECEGGPCPAKKQKQKKNKLMVVEVEDTPSDHPRSYTLAPNTRTDRSFFKMHPLNAAQKVPTV